MRPMTRTFATATFRDGNICVVFSARCVVAIRRSYARGVWQWDHHVKERVAMTGVLMGGCQTQKHGTGQNKQRKIPGKTNVCAQNKTTYI